MTSRTREIFDFAQNEPEAVEDLAAQIQQCTQEEIERVELAATAVLDAISQLEDHRGVLQIDD